MEVKNFQTVLSYELQRYKKPVIHYQPSSYHYHMLQKTNSIVQRNKERMEINMNFWDTVAGHRLADTLIRYLPDLVEKKNTEQYTVVVKSMCGEVSVSDINEAINVELKKGSRYIDAVSAWNGIVLMFEK